MEKLPSFLIYCNTRVEAGDNFVEFLSYR